MEGKSSSSSKDTSRSHHKSFGKSAHAEEPSHTVDDSGIPKRPLTHDHDWNKRQQVDFRPPQTWISVTTRVKKPPTSFDEIMDTPIDFSTFVMNRLTITNLTQELLVGPTFNLLKGTCKSLTELECHFEECSKATTERLDWHNPKGKPYPFDLRKPLPLIPDHRGRQGTSHWGVKRQRFYGFASNSESTKDVYSRKRIIAVTRLKIMKRFDYGHMDEIEVRREDQQLYIFKEDERYDLNVALCMFTRRIVIQRRVEDFQLGVESYQKKLNLTKPDTFRQDLRKRTAYTTYSDPQGVIYVDQNNINKLMCTDELYKSSDGTLDSVRTAL
ncbi:hypothetical protein Tco_0676345 [Tanacetum coccineum]